MFGIDSGELLVIAVVALVVIGPKDLPRVMRVVGQFVGRARGMASHFRSGFDDMMREAELKDMEKKWQSDNERIMREHPAQTDPDAWPEPIPDELPPAPRPKPTASTRPKPPPARARPARGAAPPLPAPRRGPDETP